MLIKYTILNSYINRDGQKWTFIQNPLHVKIWRYTYILWVIHVGVKFILLSHKNESYLKC
jgi:hypothetical protein